MSIQELNRHPKQAVGISWSGFVAEIRAIWPPRDASEVMAMLFCGAMVILAGLAILVTL